MNHVHHTITLDMTKGNTWKLIITFALPIFLSNLFQQLYNSADSAIVGQFLGTNALAAVSSSGNLIFLFNSFFIGAAMGAGVIIAKFFGEKDFDNMRRVIHTNVAVGLISAIFLTILGYFLSPHILIWMNTDKDVLVEATAYFRVYFLGIGGAVMYNFLNNILQAVGNSRRGLLYLIISSLLNIALDVLFIAVFKGGVASAALATGISHFVSMALCLLFLLKKGTIYQLRINEIRIHKDMLLRILKYGIPSGIQNSVIGLANVFVQSNINTFGGIAQAGYGIYGKIEGFAFLPITSFNLALTTFISQNLGAKEYDRARRGSRFGIICSMILAESVGLIMYFFIQYIALIFTKDAEVIQYAKDQALVACLFYFLLSFSHSISAVCRGAGKAVVPMLVMLIVWCVFRVTYINIALSISYNIKLIYLAYPITWSISSIFYFFYYHFSDWIHGFEKERTI